MTTTMTTKNQITLPKKIVDALHLRQGSLFNVKVNHNHIELIPLEVNERVFSQEDLKKLDALVKNEKKKGAAKKASSEFIANITNS